MANKWNYRHGMSDPFGFYINCPDDDVVGTHYYVDQNHPNASDTAPNAGCANVPRLTLITGFTEKKCIVAKGTYNLIGDGAYSYYIADSQYFTIGDVGVQLRYKGLYKAVTKSFGFGSASGLGVCKNSIVSENSGGISNVQPFLNCLILNNILSVLNNCVCISINMLSISGLHYNCVPPTQTSATGFYNKVFWLGTLNLNALTSDLNTICSLIGTTYPTENNAIAKVETDLGLAANTLKNNGFRLLNPHFINPLKGNFNIDWLNYDCTAILALRDSWGWIINRGVRCEYPTDFVGAVGAGFGEEPNLSDGFSGELYSRNINSLGVITNTAYDTVLVSKKYVLPQAYTLENINFFDKLISTAFELNATENDGTDTPNCYTFYLIGVKTGTLESVFNSSNNTFSYTGGVLTCDFPRFMWNRSTQLNKDDNTIYGQIENGTFDLDYMRNIYKAGVKEFRIIAVKKGV